MFIRRLERQISWRATKLAKKVRTAKKKMGLSPLMRVNKREIK